MCVRTLLDASAFRHVCESSARTAGHQLRRWITRGDGIVVYSEDMAYATELDRYGMVGNCLPITHDVASRCGSPLRMSMPRGRVFPVVQPAAPMTRTSSLWLPLAR